MDTCIRDASGCAARSSHARLRGGDTARALSLSLRVAGTPYMNPKIKDNRLVVHRARMHNQTSGPTPKTVAQEKSMSGAGLSAAGLSAAGLAGADASCSAATASSPALAVAAAFAAFCRSFLAAFLAAFAAASAAEDASA